MARHPTSRSILPFVAVALISVSALLAAPPGGCISAEVPASVVLPDGSVHPPGTMVLCFEGQLNPVTRMEAITIGGRAQGMYPGRTRPSEMRTAIPYVVFQRNDNDEWILIGLVRPPRARNETATSVRLTDPGRVEQLLALGLEQRPPGPGTVLVGNPSGEGRRSMMLAAR